MTKQIFLKKYRNAIDPKIQLNFNDNEFLQDPSIIIGLDVINIEALSSFYVARYTKNGEIDNRRIEDKITDTTTSLVRLSTAALQPAFWGLAMEGRAMPSLGELWPIPVATSTCDKTLVLDSNHTVLSIIKSSDSRTSIPIVQISGTNMENIIDDFKILNQQMN